MKLLQNYHEGSWTESGKESWKLDQKCCWKSATLLCFNNSYELSQTLHYLLCRCGMKLPLKKFHSPFHFHFHFFHVRSVCLIKMKRKWKLSTATMNIDIVCSSESIITRIAERIFHLLLLTALNKNYYDAREGYSLWFKKNEAPQEGFRKMQNYIQTFIDIQKTHLQLAQNSKWTELEASF